MDARELARSARTTAAWTACEQAADYWFALAERVELEPEQPQRIRVALSPSSSRTVYPDTMPILGYFLAVGVALFLGLVALNAYVDPGRPDGAPRAVHGSGHRVAAPGPIARLGPIGLALNGGRQFNEPELRRAEAACRPGFAAAFRIRAVGGLRFLAVLFLDFGLGHLGLRRRRMLGGRGRSSLGRLLRGLPGGLAPCPCRRACRSLSCLRSRRSSSSIPMTA